MRKKKYDNHPSDYLNKLEEWNEHQYDKGYWSGGNIPPHVNKDQLSKLFVGFFLVLILSSLLLFIGMVVYSITGKIIASWIVIALFAILGGYFYFLIKKRMLNTKGK